MENLSTFEAVFNRLGAMNGVLGKDIGEFMNVFKMIHGYQGQADADGDDSVKATGMITAEMVQIYDQFVEGHKQNEVLTDYSFTVESYVSEYLPVMPKIMYMTNFVGETNVTGYRVFELVPKEKKEGKLTVDVFVRSGDSPDNEFNFKKYKENTVAEMKKYVSPTVFKYFVDPVMGLDEINKSNKTSFSDEFKKLKIYSEGSSLMHYLMGFAIDPSIIKDELVNLDENSPNYSELLDIAEILKLHKDSSRPDDMNSLVVDVMNNQKKIDKTKDRVGELRKKLYTFVSRDENYTRVLGNHRRTLIMFLIALIITVVLLVALSLTTMLPNDKKAVALAAAASLWPAIHIIKVMFSMLSGNKKVKEGFLNDTEMGFQIIETGTGEDATKTMECNRVLAVAHFIDKYSEVLSSEIKQEYFDALSESQEKDIAMLQQLEKEHSVSSHFHQLKNNLTHYKINETDQYKKLTWNGLLVVSLIAMIYSLKIQDTINLKLFRFISGIIGVTYVTYCLLTYKGMMLRDKQDWDRFHWVVNKLESKSDSGGCNGLSGFARN